MRYGRSASTRYSGSEEFLNSADRYRIRNIDSAELRYKPSSEARREMQRADPDSEQAVSLDAESYEHQANRNRRCRDDSPTVQCSGGWALRCADDSLRLSLGARERTLGRRRNGSRERSFAADDHNSILGASTKGTTR